MLSLWGFPHRSVGKESQQCRRSQFNSLVRKICWRRDRLPTPVCLGFTCGSAGKESTCNVGDLGLIPGLGRSPGEGKCYPLQYSALENSMNCMVHGVAKSLTRLSHFHFTSFHFMHDIKLMLVFLLLICFFFNYRLHFSQQPRRAEEK